jgi:ribonuclease VapC
LVFEAAHLKARYPISYADAFAAALAKRNGAHLMTGDPEFKAVEPEVAIHWLTARR